MPGSNLRNRMIFFMFFCHYYYSANLQLSQFLMVFLPTLANSTHDYCLYSVSPTLLPLMMPRPPAPSATVGRTSD